MKAIAIICEYNPFHNGHRIQLDAVREQMEEEICIISLMSGSFVERGGPAVLSKYDRAEIALSEGADLVLELPFPWCMSGADRFAAGAVEILEGLSGVDYLAFGSESADIDNLAQIAKVISTSEFDKALGDAAASNPTLSFAALREQAYLALTGSELPKLKANDLLGVAYLSHLKAIEPMVLRRLPGFSATKARKALIEEDNDLLASHVPAITYEKLRTSLRPIGERIEGALLTHLLLIPVEELAGYAECNRELAGRIKDAVRKSKTLQEVIEKVTSKHYTSARVRRAIWHSFLRTPADLPMRLPDYTNLLAANQRGRAFLREVAKDSRIAVITRPSNALQMPEIADQFAFSDERDRIYDCLCGKTVEKKPPIMK